MKAARREKRPREMLTRFLHATSRVDFYRGQIAEKLQILRKALEFTVYIVNKQTLVSKSAIRLCFIEQLPLKGKNNPADKFPLGVRTEITSTRAF